MTRKSKGRQNITMLFLTILIVLFQGVLSDEKRLLIDDSQSMSEQLRILNDELLALKSAFAGFQHSGQGSTYVRWGRTTCPGEAELMYKGYVGGSHYTHSGGAANWLCLPSNPEWGYYEENAPSGAKVYGGEYELGDYLTDGGSKFFGKNLNDEDAPCAVCRVERSSTVMVPARLTCPDDSWSKEYTMVKNMLNTKAKRYVKISTIVRYNEENDSRLPNMRHMQDKEREHYSEGLFTQEKFVGDSN